MPDNKPDYERLAVQFVEHWKRDALLQVFENGNLAYTHLLEVFVDATGADMHTLDLHVKIAAHRHIFNLQDGSV